MKQIIFIPDTAVCPKCERQYDIGHWRATGLAADLKRIVPFGGTIDWAAIFCSVCHVPVWAQAAPPDVAYDERKCKMTSDLPHTHLVTGGTIGFDVFES